MATQSSKPGKEPLVQAPKGENRCSPGWLSAAHNPNCFIFRTDALRRRPRQGKVRFLTADMTLWPSHRRARAGISYVPQGRQIFPFLTVHENLLMGLEAVPTRQRLPESVEQMHDLFPALKLDPRKAAGTLSGGQEQQLALARALVRQPRLLLLDEPTEGIQPSIVQETADLLQGLRQQRQTTILLVEQFLDFALSVADYCYIMEKGAIVLEGAIEELEQGLVRDYLAV